MESTGVCIEFGRRSSMNQIALFTGNIHLFHFSEASFVFHGHEASISARAERRSFFISSSSVFQGVDLIFFALKAAHDLRLTVTDFHDLIASHDFVDRTRASFFKVADHIDRVPIPPRSSLECLILLFMFQELEAVRAGTEAEMIALIDHAGGEIEATSPDRRAISMAAVTVWLELCASTQDVNRQNVDMADFGVELEVRTRRNPSRRETSFACHIPLSSDLRDYRLYDTNEPVNVETRVGLTKLRLRLFKDGPEITACFDLLVATHSATSIFRCSSSLS